ncbi:TetR/AcrR family transcriptional regulator [Streptomyces sp. NBC_00872]|uniref:TetR/AcrR family transcriptional regulator n=1 Tax=Streptomyces sp. NBC_00872 TaxID=2903686 RepID=UPI0038647DD3|nr:TetR/AcrR family transcriptional regulator [Streptomyces sp. NBC_00872]
MDTGGESADTPSARTGTSRAGAPSEGATRTGISRAGTPRTGAAPADPSSTSSTDAPPVRGDRSAQTRRDGRTNGTGHQPPGGDHTAGMGQDRRAQRRQRLLTTALGLFTTRGYTGTSIERICAGAHVSIRAFYEEFESREAVLIALHNDVARAGMEAALTVLSDPAAESASTRERITALTHAYVDAVTADPAATRIAFIEVVGAGQALDDHRLLWRGLWAGFLTGEAERAVGRGEAVPRDYTLAMVALIGAVNELMAHWARDSGSLTRRRLADELVHHALATLGIPPGGPAADEGE